MVDRNLSVFLSPAVSDQARLSPRSDNYLRPPMLLSVDAADDEEVEWIWTHDADGRSMVTGYRIVPKLLSSLGAT